METCQKNSGNGEEVMTEDTKFQFPRTRKGHVIRIAEMRLDREQKDWFKRCMEDSPIHETKYGLWEEWAEKWFGQFKEYHLGVDYARPNIDYSVMPPEITMCHICGGKWLSQMSVYCPHCAKEKEEPKESKTAIPIAVTHYRCPHCNAVDSMLVQKLEDKKGFCIKCFKEMEMEDTEPTPNR